VVVAVGGKKVGSMVREEGGSELSELSEGRADMFGLR